MTPAQDPPPAVTTAMATAGPRVTVGRVLRNGVIDPLVRGAAGLPLAIAAVPMALVGCSDTAGRMQSRLALRFNAGAVAAAPARRQGPVRVIGHSLMVALPALASALLAALVAFTFYSGYLYPLRPDASFAIGHPLTSDPRFAQSWGGPTLAGAWFIHSCIALGIQVGCLLVLGVLVRLQGRITRQVL
jgi:hypothetical protein